MVNIHAKKLEAGEKGNPGNQEAAILDGSMMRWGVRRGGG